jgi:hypothetical protein
LIQPEQVYTLTNNLAFFLTLNKNSPTTNHHHQTRGHP